MGSILAINFFGDLLCFELVSSKEGAIGVSDKFGLLLAELGVFNGHKVSDFVACLKKAEDDIEVLQHEVFPTSVPQEFLLFFFLEVA